MQYAGIPGNVTLNINERQLMFQQEMVSPHCWSENSKRGFSKKRRDRDETVSVNVPNQNKNGTINDFIFMF